MKWKIQLEENTTSHSPEHVGGGFAESDSLNWPVIFGYSEGIQKRVLGSESGEASILRATLAIGEV